MIRLELEPMSHGNLVISYGHLYSLFWITPVSVLCLPRSIIPPFHLSLYMPSIFKSHNGQIRLAFKELLRTI